MKEKERCKGCLKIIKIYNKNYYWSHKKPKVILTPEQKKEKFVKRLCKRFGEKILTDYENLKTLHPWNLVDIGLKHGFSRERARQIYTELYGGSYCPRKKEKLIQYRALNNA